MGNKNLCIFILIATIAAQASLFVAADDGPVFKSVPGPTHKVYVVGDCKGWNAKFDYKAWAAGKEFYMGDQLVFNYTKGQHNVIKVDEAGLNQCTIPSDPNVIMDSGYDIVTLVSMGGVGYISGVGKDCQTGGMKLFLPNVKCPHTRPPKPLQAGRKLIPSD